MTADLMLKSAKQLNLSQLVTAFKMMAKKKIKSFGAIITAVAEIADL